MFFGSHARNLDSKNRLMIPPKFREELGNAFFVTKDLDGCLAIYPKEEWQKEIDKIRQLPPTKKETRIYINNVIGNAYECEMDSQGRILLPTMLMQNASITKECMVVGSIDKIQIWDAKLHEEFSNMADEQFEKTAEQLEYR